MTRVKSIKPPKKAGPSDLGDALALIVERASKEIKKTAEKAGVKVDVIIQVIPTTTREEGVGHGS